MWKNIIIYLTEVRERIPSVMTRKNYEYNPSDSISNSAKYENSTELEQGIPRRGLLMAAGTAAVGGALAVLFGKKRGSEATPTSQNTPTPKKTPARATAAPETTPASETTPTLNPDFIKNNTDVFEWGNNVGDLLPILKEQKAKLEGEQSDVLGATEYGVRQETKKAFLNFMHAIYGDDYPCTYLNEYGEVASDNGGDIEKFKEYVVQKFDDLHAIEVILSDQGDLGVDGGVSEEDRELIADSFFYVFSLGFAKNDFKMMMKQEINSCKESGKRVELFNVRKSKSGGKNYSFVEGAPRIVAISSANDKSLIGSPVNYVPMPFDKFNIRNETYTDEVGIEVVVDFNGRIRSGAEKVYIARDVSTLKIAGAEGVHSGNEGADVITIEGEETEIKTLL